MPPRNVRHPDRDVFNTLAWYYWVFNPVLIGFYNPTAAAIRLSSQVYRTLDRYCIYTMYGLTAIMEVFSSLRDLASSIMSFIPHIPTILIAPLRGFHAFIKFWTSRVAIILGIFHFCCFSAYTSYLAVTPTLCWLDRDCRGFPTDVTYGDFLLSVPAAPAVKFHNFITAPRSHHFESSTEKTVRAVFFLQVSAKTAAGIARAMTESVPFSTAALFTLKEEFLPGALETPDGIDGRDETTRKDKATIRATKMDSKPALTGHTPLSKNKGLLQAAVRGGGSLKKQQEPKKQSSANINLFEDQCHVDGLEGDGPPETWNEEPKSLIQPSLFERFFRAVLTIITNFPTKVYLTASSLHYMCVTDVYHAIISFRDGDMSFSQVLHVCTTGVWFIFTRKVYLAKIALWCMREL